MTERKSRRLRFIMLGASVGKDCRVEDFETREPIQGVSNVTFSAKGPNEIPTMTVEIECAETWGGIVQIQTDTPTWPRQPDAGPSP